jgi:hypothetical protein
MTNPKSILVADATNQLGKEGKVAAANIVSEFKLNRENLKTVCEETQQLSPCDSVLKRLQINYNRSTGVLWSNLHYGVNKNWTAYKDEDILIVCVANSPMGEDELESAVQDRLSYEDDKYLAVVREWKNTLGTSTLSCPPRPAGIKWFLKEGLLRAVMIDSLDCPHAHLRGHRDSQNRYAYIDVSNKMEKINFCEFDDSKVKRIVGFVDKQNRYVGHAYIGDKDYAEIFGIDSD